MKKSGSKHKWRERLSDCALELAMLLIVALIGIGVSFLIPEGIREELSDDAFVFIGTAILLLAVLIPAIVINKKKSKESKRKMDNTNKSCQEFITYAHRGASEYCPENTFMSFYMGIQMGANGIETDVQKAKDGTLVLFHDDTLTRVTGKQGSISDYTYSELNTFLATKASLHDKIPTFIDFLEHFAYRDISFAIELKVGGIEKEVADLIYRYGIESKTVVTSFNLDYLKRMKEYAPELRIGYLASEINSSLISELQSINAYEICPFGPNVTSESVNKWHEAGFNVRAWGISNEDIMKQVFEAGADGMTVNFPDKLIKYIKKKDK